MTRIDWLAEFGQKNHCCLCGNWGFIDTRGKVFTPAGFPCGDLVYCVCPNGRAMKRKKFDLNEQVRLFGLRQSH